MKSSVLFILILIALASVTANAQTTDAALANGNDVAMKEIRGWLDRWTKAFTAKDVDAIMALYADDVIAYDVVPPLQYAGKAEYRTDYLQFLSQYGDNLKVEVRDLHVGANGDLGYAAGLELISGTLKNGQKSELWVRFTSLFRKSGGHWLDFHDHVSVPADIESGKAMLELKP
jgi:ketosteroid isomerase-like protein